MISCRSGSGAITRLAGVQDLYAEVNAPPGQDPTAVAVWLSHHPSWTPWLVEVKDGGETVAAMGLAVRPWRGMLQCRGLGADDEERLVAATGPAAAAALGRAVGSRLTEENRRWALRLGLLVADPRAQDFAHALPHAAVRHADICPQSVFVPGEPLGSYVSRKMRDNANRARNLATRAGTPLVSRWLTDPACIAEILPEVVQVHRARNRQVRGYAILDRAGEVAQFRDQILAHARTGTTHLLEVRAAGELAAFSVCFTNGAVMRVYANLVSPRWLHVNAGTFASVEIVRRAHADPAVGVLSWGAGASRYKLSCATVAKELQTVHGYSSPSARSLWMVLRPRRQRKSSDSDPCADPPAIEAAAR